MKIECFENDPEMYATNLLQNENSKKLVWDSTGGVDALIVQTAYGEPAQIEDVCRELEKKNMEDLETMQNRYVSLSLNMWCRYVSSVERAKNNGCEINGRPATYTVFACSSDKDAGIVRLYASQTGGMIKPFCDIQVQLHIEVTKEMETRWLSRKQAETGFYSLNFLDGFYDGYRDGDLVYSVDGFEIPVTNEMFLQQKVYVKTDTKPELKEKNNGLRLL